jgi:hypothetical protein
MFIFNVFHPPTSVPACHSPSIHNTKNMPEITILWLELPLLLLQADKHSKINYVILTVHPYLPCLSD